MTIAHASLRLGRAKNRKKKFVWLLTLTFCHGNTLECHWKHFFLPYHNNNKSLAHGSITGSMQALVSNGCRLDAHCCKPWAARAGVHVPVMVRRLNTSSDIRPLSGQDQHTNIIPVVHGMNAQEQVKFWSCPATI